MGCRPARGSEKGMAFQTCCLWRPGVDAVCATTDTPHILSTHVMLSSAVPLKKWTHNLPLTAAY